MLSLIQSRDAQKGFTLVELAIVLVIIGILLTGLLKGAELINNAKVKSALQQIRSIDAATTSFQDSYRFYPGDLPNAAARLPNCVGLCAAVPAGGASGTAGDLMVGSGTAASISAAHANDGTAERTLYFQHLAAANLIGGVNVSANAAATFGDGLLATSLGTGGYKVGSLTAAGTLTGNGFGTPVAAQSGLYLATSSTPGAVTGTGGTVRPVDAQQLDLKIDDGDPSRGSFRSSGGIGTGVTDCASDVAGSVPAYWRTSNTSGCDFYSKIQN